MESPETGESPSVQGRLTPKASRDLEETPVEKRLDQELRRSSQSKGDVESSTDGDRRRPGEHMTKRLLLIALSFSLLACPPRDEPEGNDEIAEQPKETSSAGD